MYDFIKGGTAEDARGKVRFVNEFDMSEVKRFYTIKNRDIKVVRGWRAHRIERRWFYALFGSFAVDLVKINNWEDPDRELSVTSVILSAKDNKVLHIPAGYGTAFQSLEDDSELLVFADHHLEHATLDDYTYELEYFKNKKLAR